MRAPTHQCESRTTCFVPSRAPFRRSRAAGAAAFVFAGLALFAAGKTRAENLIRVGYGEGAPGDRGIHVIVTATNDTPIHGYSIALSFPADSLALTNFGVEGTHVRDFNPEFVAPVVDNQLGIATLGVIIDFSEPFSGRSLPPTAEGEAPRIIARLTFDVRAGATGGIYPLRLIDGIGNPAAFNRFTTAGASIAPRLEDGRFFVAGGNVLLLEKKIAIAGASPNVPVRALARHPDPLSGFSIGFSYNCDALVLNSATYAATDLGFELGNAGKIEFYDSDVDTSFGPEQCRARTAAIFDFVEPFEGQTLSPSLDDPPSQSLMVYSFNVRAAAAAEREFQDLLLEDLDIPGALNPAFIVGGQSISPRRIHGKIYFSTGNLRGRVLDALTGLPIAGARVTTEPDGFTALTGADGAYLIENLFPGTYDLKVTKPGHYPSLCEGILVEGKGMTGDAGDCLLYAIPVGGGGLFVRGRVNADSRIDVADGIWLLNWLFKGGPQPPCLQSADTNNDNRNDISDAVYLLNWLFTGGPPPPPPLDTCGPDPDGGPLSCETSPGCS